MELGFTIGIITVLLFTIVTVIIVRRSVRETKA
jgi:hypothetical protein